MKVSINWIRDINAKYQCSADPLPDGIDKLVEKIGAQLGAVDEVIDLGKKYEGIVVAKIVSCVKHPDADKLSICLIDDGGVIKGVARNKNGLVQVVCGAANARDTLAVAWIPPGVVVPATIDKDPFILEARDIRGVTSHGMLASPKELDLGDNHEGILEIDEKIKPGQSFASVYGLDDYIIDIENKMFTHRPDLFGLLGIARELAGIQGYVFKSPPWYKVDARLPGPKNSQLELKVANDVPKLVPRFCMVTMNHVTVGPSPMWLQTYLSRGGIRPINNIVDITNYIMMVTGQPLHAYDYDKVKDLSKNSAVIKVRLSGAGEELRLLGGKRLKLQAGSVVIATDQEAIGLGGVMGGADTEVDKNTKNIILEAGSFEMNQTRKTAMAYGLFTDAATRFTKNQSPLQNLAALERAVASVEGLTGGKVASQLFDLKENVQTPRAVNISSGFINDRLGLNLTPKDIRKLLENVEFEVDVSDEKLIVKPPFWRTDIGIREDIVEEVGRLYGYDHLPLELPLRGISPAETDPLLKFKSRLRDIMARAGANEVLTYSFVNKRLLEASGQKPEEAFHIRNALSPDLQYYRLSLAPSLLEKIHPNKKNGFDGFALYELGKAHAKWHLGTDKLPIASETLVSVVTNSSTAGAPYYQARRLADYIFDELNINRRKYQPLHKGKTLNNSTWDASYEPRRSAVVWAGQTALGVVGEPTAALRTALKLPVNVAMLELDITSLLTCQEPDTYQSLNRFPSSSQDICLRMAVDLSHEDIDHFLQDELDSVVRKEGYNYEIETIDIFQRANDKDHKQITWRITLAHPMRTLTTDEISMLLDGLAGKSAKKFGAKRI